MADTKPGSKGNEATHHTALARIVKRLHFEDIARRVVPEAFEQTWPRPYSTRCGQRGKDE